ncbi:MAG: leucyl/phenylalanyl-tRNA--protein transferase [Flavobacteriales bacterium]|nr:leucyl/phenylalanyl-tRNA--protein transferase [Flavobacteriales bacterium]
MSETAPPLTADLLLRAYHRGWFPMAHEDGELYWHDPDPRAIFPLAQTRPNARLQRALRRAGYHITFDQRFEEVMRACGDRKETWITEEMIAAYVDLHKQGYAHSVEVWAGDRLVGGLYGIALGAAFFGESMFSRNTNASKAAFHHLAAHLRQQGFSLFDSQYINDHTASLGAIEVPRSTFRMMLAEALRNEADF